MTASQVRCRKSGQGDCKCVTLTDCCLEAAEAEAKTEAEAKSSLSIWHVHYPDGPPFLTSDKTRADRGIRCGASVELIGELSHDDITAAGLVKTEGSKWECMGRKQALPEPGECNWPDCGCDPHATKVIESLIEQGWNALTLKQPGAMREALEQIIQVCLDNEEPNVRHDLALKFVRDVARASLFTPDAAFQPVAPHLYVPDQNHQMMGDCRVCGQIRNSPIHTPPDAGRTEGE